MSLNSTSIASSTTSYIPYSSPTANYNAAGGHLQASQTLNANTRAHNQAIQADTRAATQAITNMLYEVINIANAHTANTRGY